jgi:uncharacterized membrane protein YkvA (DUF1232 family)
MNNSIQSIYNWYRSTLRNPKYRWWIILGTVAYFFSPIDIAPDFIPVVGQIDDIALVTLLVAELSQIAVDYFKTRKAEVEESTNSVNTASTVGNSTVDVEATSLNQ